jgi:hypothetical protein
MLAIGARGAAGTHAIDEARATDDLQVTDSCRLPP